MANTIQVQATLGISDGLGSKQLSRSFSVAQAGSRFFSAVQAIGTVAETLAVGDCANLKYIALANPSANTATVTCTIAAIILAPGDVALFRPTTSNVTLVATTAADVAAQGSEA